MTAPARHGNQRTAPTQAAEKGSGPTTGLIAAAFVHAGVLAWALGSSGPPPAVRLPHGAVIAAAATLALLVIFLIAAFARRSALSFVVVPAMIVAGVSTHSVSSVTVSGSAQAHVLAGVLGFGCLSVAITLSFGAAAIAARVAPSWSELALGRSPAFRLGALGLVAVLGVAMISEQLAPLAALASTVGIIALGAILDAVEREPKRGLAMAELVSAIALSLGAIWTASIVAGATRAAAFPNQWHAAQTAMRFAWITAVPLVLAALVAMGPRLVSTGRGVKLGRSTVLAATIGAITCVGLSEVVLRESAEALSAPALDQRTHSGKSNKPLRPSPTRAPKKDSNKAGAGKSTPRGGGDPSAAAAAAEDGERELLAYESEQTKLDISIKIDGPMLPKDARQGVEKSFKRLIECYEESSERGEASTIRLGLLIDDVGSVKQAEPIDSKHSDAKYVTCVQLALYRSGFSGPAKLTWLELVMTFAPKG